MASFNGKLFVAWRGETNNFIHIAVSDNGNEFSVYRLRETTTTTPCLVANTYRIFLSWQAEDPSRRIHISSSRTGLEEQWTGVAVLTASNGTPSLAVIKEKLVCAWLEPDERSRLAITKPGTLKRLVAHHLSRSGMYADNAASNRPASPADETDMSAKPLRSKL